MFGTLHVTDDVQKPVPLQFVENRDLSSALSRNSRDRPHVSCELCRARKVRCSGQSSGCNRCEAVGVECRYPPREPRRKAAQGGRKTAGELSTQGTSSGDDKTASKNGEPQQPQRDTTPAQEEERPFRQYSESSEAGALFSATSPQIFEQEMESEYLYQDLSDGGFDMNLAPRCGGEQSVKDGLDEWLDINCILDTSLPSSSGGADNLRYFDATMIDPSLVDDSMERISHLSALKNFDPTLSACNTPGLDQSAEDLLMLRTARTLSPLPQATQSERSSSTASKISTSTSNSDRPRRSTLAASSSYTNIPSMQRIREPDYAQLQSRSPVSSSSSSSRTPVSLSSRGSPCCLQLAACLVEELGAKAAASDRASMDVLLGDFRGALAQCAAILNCERCATARENNMLLAMAAKYMSTICECVAVCYAEMRRTQGGEHIHSSAAGGGGTSDNNTSSWRGGCGEDGGGNGVDHESDRNRPDEIRFSTYRIENSRERMQVLGCLVNVQISEFAQMVARLKTRPGIRRGHLMLLTEASSKVNTLQAMLRGGGGNSPFRSGMQSIY